MDDPVPETITFRYDTVLGAIRMRPAIYLGAKSLTRLNAFTLGYSMGCTGNPNCLPLGIPGDFHEWVAYRLHFYESTSGYCYMILERARDEAVALDRFFQLIDEHARREETVVAVIRTGSREWTTNRLKDDAWVRVHHTHPEDLRIVVYGDDPGFFLAHDSDYNLLRQRWFVPHLKSVWMEIHQLTPSKFEVKNEAIWQRLLLEDAAMEKEFAERSSPTEGEIGDQPDTNPKR